LYSYICSIILTTFGKPNIAPSNETATQEQYAENFGICA
jgi:hypothetical protein